MSKYANNWEKMAEAEPAKLERMKSLVGDGKVGHGTLRDGKVYFSDADINAIVDAQRDEAFSFEDEILNGAKKHPFRLVADDADKDVESRNYFVGMPEVGSIMIDGIHGSDLKNDDGYIYSEEEPAVFVNHEKLIQDYKVGLGVDLDEDSAKRLAKKIETRMNAYLSSNFRDVIRDNQDSLYDRWRDARDMRNYRQSGR